MIARVAVAAVLAVVGVSAVVLPTVAMVWYFESLTD